MPNEFDSKLENENQDELFDSALEAVSDAEEAAEEVADELESANELEADELKEEFDEALSDTSDKVDLGAEEYAYRTVVEPSFVDDTGAEPLVSSPAESSQEPNIVAKSAQGAAAAVGNAAKGAGRNVIEGFSAMKSVRAAAREHAGAKNRLKDMQAAFDEDSQKLAHRDEINAAYDTIVTEQQAIIGEAQELAHAAQEEISRLTAESDNLSTQLTQLKADNEQAIRPYRQLWEAAQGRSEDAARLLGEAKRALKLAERERSDAASRKDQSINSANRALENATDRKMRLQDELQKLQSDPNTSASTIAKMQSDVAAALAHEDTARRELTNATTSGEKAVERASEELVSQQNSFERASAENENAKAEAAARKEEYNKLFNQAADAERALQDAIDERTTLIEQQRSALSDEHARINAAQVVLDEAEDIHAHPEVTEQLRAAVAEQEAAVQSQISTIDELAGAERDLRTSTRTQRIFFIVAIVLALAIIALIVFLVLTGSKDASTATDTAQAAAEAATQADSAAAAGVIVRMLFG